MYTHSHATFAFLPHFPPFFSLKHLPTPLLPSPAKPFLEDFVMNSFVNTSLVGILIESRSRLYLHFYKYHAWMCVHIAVSKWPKYMAALVHIEQRQICKEWKTISSSSSFAKKQQQQNTTDETIENCCYRLLYCLCCIRDKKKKIHPIPNFCFAIQRFPFVSAQCRNTPNPLF